MKKIFYALLITFLILSSCSEENVNEPADDNSTYLKFNYNGIERKYLLYKPSNLPANAPLVFVLHSFLRSAASFYNIGFNQVADTAKFAVCYPQGINFTWEIGSHNSMDVGFLKELAEYLQIQHSLSSSKTYATGFSVGGAMCNLLALDANDTFKAVAPVAGFVSQSIWEDKNPRFYIPYFTIHGTEDQIVNINGISENDPSVQNIVDYWRTANNCATQETVQFTTNTTAYYYRDGTLGKEVWFYKISRLNHIWPGAGSSLNSFFTDVSGFNACQEIWNFFRKW